MTGAFTIRRFASGDEPHLHDVFHSAIHVHAARDYTLEQRLAWSPEIVDDAFSARWAERVRGIVPFVVEVDEPDGPRIAAYGDVQPDGHIDHFFVAGHYGGRGVGTLLMKHLLATARVAGIRVLTSDVSLTAQGFFARFGFVIVERQWPVARGVTMENARMRLDLEPPTTG
jgi:putative acetyltransferase